ncbi:MAG: SMI1/KNR4 family protein [Pseudomonadota bacterium]|nr:SMI1/KNR4 family protein [Pseudomonadota bacterium]
MNIRMTESEKKLTPHEIEKAEKTLNLQLPEEYKRFLLLYNGGHPEPGKFKYICDDHQNRSLVAWFLAIYEGKAENFSTFYKTYKGRIPEDTIAIARDPGGNLILLGIEAENRGKLFFWLQDFEVEEGEIPDYSNVCLIADSFDEFFNSLF